MKIIAYTGASCFGNRGVGGYSAILTCNGLERKVSGYSTKATTTSNEMELKAVLEVVNWLNTHQKCPCEIEICTKSKYILDCAKSKNKDGSARKDDWFAERPNSDLWFQLIEARRNGKHKIRFIKITDKDELNEKCSKLAKEACAIARHKLLEG